MNATGIQDSWWSWSQRSSSQERVKLFLLLQSFCLFLSFRVDLSRWSAIYFSRNFTEHQWKGVLVVRRNQSRCTVAPLLNLFPIAFTRLHVYHNVKIWLYGIRGLRFKRRNRSIMIWPALTQWVMWSCHRCAKHGRKRNLSKTSKFVEF
jgi:hypothetical protein